jgi:hypothetical protein
MTNKTLDQFVSAIESKYDRLGHKLGWRFLCVHSQVLQSAPQIALITANPGGDRIQPDYPSASCENGCAYLVEEWNPAPAGQHKLQRQVQCLFDAIARHSDYAQGGAGLMDSSLIGYYIPFRSPRLASLHKKEESLAFGQWLWSELLQQVTPKLIITIDKNTYTGVGNILSKVLRVPASPSGPLPTGWGKVTANIDTYHSASCVTKLVRLPHLSTFQLFTSTKCESHVDAIITRACAHL